MANTQGIDAETQQLLTTKGRVLRNSRFYSPEQFQNAQNQLQEIVQKSQ
jgi:hypothetical protein